MPAASETTRRPDVDAMKAYSILQMRISGYQPIEIARHLKIDEATVRHVIKAAADETRKQAREIVNEQFFLALRRNESLYNMLQKKLDNYEALGGEAMGLAWKDVLDTVKVMLQLLVRQSDLLGLDNDRTKTANQGKSGVNDWIADPNVSIQKVAEEATRAGIRVPSSFVTEGMKWSVPLTESGLS